MLKSWPEDCQSHTPEDSSLLFSPPWVFYPSWFITGAPYLGGATQSPPLSRGRVILGLLILELTAEPYEFGEFSIDIAILSLKSSLLLLSLCSFWKWVTKRPVVAADSPRLWVVGFPKLDSTSYVFCEGDGPFRLGEWVTVLWSWELCLTFCVNLVSCFETTLWLSLLLLNIYW